MENFKGTSGEWLVEQTESTGVTITNEDGTQAIAFIPPLYEKSTANVQLITAAPDLLEACQEALKELQFHNWQNTTTGFKLEQAINKALNV